MSPDDIIKLLQQLAEQLTPPAQHVWELAVKQTFIEGIEAAIFLAFIVIVTLIYAYVGKHYIWPSYIKAREGNQGKAYYDKEDFFGVWLIYGLVGLAVGMILLFSMIFLIPTIITNIFNPEWQTIIKLSRLVIKST